MPYVTPTFEDFTSRFPIFADADEEVVSRLLEEAARTIDTSWIEDDYQPAILYLTAHLLATDNSEEGASVSVGAAGAGSITSESFGGMSISYSQGNTSGSLSSSEQYGSTEYGRRFLSLLKRNQPPIVVV